MSAAGQHNCLMMVPDYPFTPKRLEVRPGIWFSYLDEGPADGEPVVMLHGNPSWSYYWRHLVSGLSSRYRCLVPDHVGMGLSDKPSDQRYHYTLRSRIEDLTVWLDTLKITGSVTLVVHDWGGMVGFGWALNHPAQIKRLVITNTAAFPLPVTKTLPWPIALGRHWKVGEWLIRAGNVFALGAAWFGVKRGMPKAVRRAFVRPYDNWENRIATVRFIQDIPLRAGDPAWSLVTEVEQNLSHWADRPTLIAWGLQDFVFDHRFLDRFRQLWPNAHVLTYPDAGHYVLEDVAEQLIPQIRQFLDNHSLS